MHFSLVNSLCGVRLPEKDYFSFWYLVNNNRKVCHLKCDISKYYFLPIIDVCQVRQKKQIILTTFKNIQDVPGEVVIICAIKRSQYTLYIMLNAQKMISMLRPLNVQRYGNE